MKKFTKLFLALALLVVGVGTANAERITRTPRGCYGAQFNASTNTMTWDGPSGWHILWTDIPGGDITNYQTFHVTLSDFSDNASYIRLVIKDTKDPAESVEVNLTDGENTIDLKALMENNTNVDYTSVADITLWGGANVEGKTIDGDNKASVVITNMYVDTKDEEIDGHLVCEGGAKANAWDRQAQYDLPTPMEAGKTYIVKADIKSAKSGPCALWTSWEASENKNEWGGTNDVLYLASYTTGTTIDTYTWEFEATWAIDRISFVFGQHDGTMYFDNVSIKEKDSDIELVVNGDFSIKSMTGWNNAGNTKMSVEEVPNDPLLIFKENLQAEITLGNAQNAFGKTEESFATLTSAINDANTALAAEDATEESLTAAKTAITDAIAGLKLKDGYTNLTAAMFKEHASTAIDAAITGNTGCSYVINEASDLPYGDGSVSEKKWADLAEFSQFIAVSANDIPRFCMNRMEAGANHNDTKADAKFVDIKATESTWWEVVDYLTIDESKYTVDLKKVVADFGVARLHCIKGKAYQVTTTLTDMLLYRTITVGDAGFATFGSVSKNAKPNGVKAYAAKLNGTKVELTEVTNVPAGKGVVIEATAAGNFAPTFDVEAADIESDLLVSNGTVTGDGSTIFVLAKKNDVVGFYKLKEGDNVPAGKAYLKVANAGSREFIAIDGGATAIKSVETEKANGAVYNLAGQQVKSAQKGVFIMNGKKVIK